MANNYADREPQSPNEYWLKQIAGEDVDPASPFNREPQSANEYWLKQIAEGGGGGGSSLPSYTSSDVGKVLTVSQKSETVVVVPEQTVTTDENGEAPLTGVDFSRLTDGQSIVVVLSGQQLPCQYSSEQNVIGQNRPSGFRTIVSSTTLFSGAPAVTVTVSSSFTVPAVIESPFIPEQTVTISDGMALLSDVTVLPADAGTGTNAVLTVTADGETQTISLTWNAETYGFENDDNTVAVAYDVRGGSWVVFVDGGDGTYTLSAVLQKPVPEVTWSFNQGGVEGTYYIDSNGTFDVSTYAEAEVSVPASAVVSGTKTITTNGSNIDVTDYAAVDVSVPASAVTSGGLSITQNGTYDVTTYKNAVVNVPSPYEGYTHVTFTNNFGATISVYSHENIGNERISNGASFRFTAPLLPPDSEDRQTLKYYFRVLGASGIANATLTASTGTLVYGPSATEIIGYLTIQTASDVFPEITITVSPAT